MKRRKFLSMAPSSIFLPFVMQYCTDDEFDRFVIAEGELETGEEWAITSMDSSELTETDTKKDFETLPALFDVQTEHQNSNPSYLDQGNVYEISFKVAVPVRHAFDGVSFDFNSFGGFPWKLLFDFTYSNESEQPRYSHPPKKKYIVYKVKYTFEFERYLRRFFVMIDDTTEDSSDSETPQEQKANWTRTPRF